MKYVRIPFRLVAFAAITIAAYLGSLTTRLWGLVRPSGYVRAQEKVITGWARSSLWALGVRVEMEGTPPERPCILVCNHLSYVDPIVLMSRTPCFFVIKRDVRSWPGIGQVLWAAGMLFVDRKRKQDLLRSFDEVRDGLAEGRGVAIFPEGTSSDGSGVLPFKPSFLEVAVQLGLPVHYASLTYRTPPGYPSARENVCWWGDMTFFDHLLKLFALPRVDAKLVFGHAPIAETDRKTLAERIQGAVEAQFEPVPAS